MWVFLNRNVLQGGIVSTSPNPQAGGPHLVSCPRLLIQFIRSYPPYRRPFLYPQPEDAPCHGDRDTLHGLCEAYNMTKCAQTAPYFNIKLRSFALNALLTLAIRSYIWADFFYLIHFACTICKGILQTTGDESTWIPQLVWTWWLRNVGL